MDAHAATLIPFGAHLAAIDEATERIAEALRMSWPGAPVPTCPEWQLLDLLAHLGMVHRWATAMLTDDRATIDNAARIEVEGRLTQDLPRWLREGAAQLRATLQAAPDDLEALVFLTEAPPAKQFWARRQCHETTVHALDALATQHERRLTAHDAWFGADLAADGVDELVCGFWQRGRNAHRSPDPYAVLLAPTDAPLAWLVEVGPDGTAARRMAGGSDSDHGATSDHVVSGSAVDLYLALWHRGGEVSDPDGIIARWAAGPGISWS